MLKAETLKDLILNMGKQKETGYGDDKITSFCYEINLSKEQHDTWLEQFKLLEQNNFIHSVGNNEPTLEACACWSGNSDTDLKRFVVTLLKDIVILQWVTKFSIEKPE